MVALHELPITENPLINNIRGTLPAISKTELLRPGNELFGVVAGLARDEIRLMWRRIGDYRKKKNELEGLHSKLAAGLQNEQKLRDQLKVAFGVEKPFIQKKIDEQAHENYKLKEARDGLQKKFEDIWNHGKQFKKWVKRTIKELLEHFPQAQLIDLTCMAHFKLPNGLPALGIFSIHDGYSQYRIENSYDKATICLYSSSENRFRHPERIDLINEHYSESLLAMMNDICQVTGLKVGNVRIQGKTGVAEAIYLTAAFQSLGGAIPQEAREIIKRAHDSKLFEKIYLLAEIREWKVEYQGSEGNAKIQGDLVPESKYKNRDPLIIGVKKIHGYQLPFVIGHFDTSPLEQLLADEFCVKSEN